MVSAEWSEHCSYKSSKKHLKQLPMSGPRVISETGFDSGVLDVGDGYVVTIHIESHNHPSAVEPYGGAATGVGGVIRDILSAGTRPVALLDGLRFGDIRTDAHARWLFKNAVSGIADYGNCLGIPTISGEVEFDESYRDYALVDVAAIGFGRRDRLIKNHANPGDLVVLVGGSTGRDGIGGSQFASDNLESEDRSAVQVPDPFIEKLTIEAILEARNAGIICALKDLGGGGLSCAVSETASTLSVGVDFDLDSVHIREPDMAPGEIMISESQERMLVVISPDSLEKMQNICAKFDVACSVVGTIRDHQNVHVTGGGGSVADISANIVSHAPLLDRPAKRPAYLDDITADPVEPSGDIGQILLQLLSAPNIASKRWVYEQYDHEVGIRTVIRPGRDASSLRLDNGKFLSVKIDGNPKHCYIDPYNGAVGCFEEACRNVVCTGAEPIGMVDHLQFGNPEDAGIFWTFKESVRGLAEFARHIGVPCVGGKVSLYNETPRGPIKPTPVIGVVGLANRILEPAPARDGDVLIVAGQTHDELGGSELYEYVYGHVGGTAPRVDFDVSKRAMKAMLDIIKSRRVRAVHDCSKGGIGIAAAELAIESDMGVKIDMQSIPASDTMHPQRLLFSESHSRYLLIADESDAGHILDVLERARIPAAQIGRFGGDQISGDSFNLSFDKARDAWNRSLGEQIRV